MGAHHIVLIIIVAIVVIAFIGGYLAVRRRDRQRAGRYLQDVKAADMALEGAFSVDKGWDRGVLERAARDAVTGAHPGLELDGLHLVRVEDKPGTDEDSAQFIAVGGGREIEIVLARQGDSWVAESVS
jgi:hypothetical protein